MKVQAAVLILMMPAATGAAEPGPSSCVIVADKQAPVKVEPGRAVYCGLDLGSRSAKLSVVSIEPGRSATVRDERSCCAILVASA